MARSRANRSIPKEALLDREAEARALDEMLVERARAGRLADRDVAYGVARIAAERLFIPLGFGTAAKYAVRRGFADSEGNARDLINLVKRLERRPKIRAAFDAGQLPWTKARELVKIATEDDEDEWLARSHLSIDALQRLARVKRGEADTFKVNLEVTAEQWARIQAAAGAQLEAARAAELPISFGEALARACEVEAAARAPEKLVKYHCQDCGEGSLQTRDGPLPISQASIEAAYCDAEVTDITGEPTPVTRTIPEKVRQFVLARAKFRCQAPGCPNPADHIHHVGGWRQGHDPRSMRAVCWTHHDAVHDELIGMTCTPDGGLLLTTASGAVADTGPSTPPEPPRPRAPSSLAGDAAKALRSLGLRAREAKAVVERARAALVERGEAPTTLEALVREALLHVPVPGVSVASQALT
jgi:hypothetical protein